MDQNTYNYLSFVVSVVSLVVAAIGLFAVYIQVRKIKDATWSNTNSKLCDQSFELLKFFSQFPECYDYFYLKKPLSQDMPNRIQVLFAAEALANFMEHLILQKDNLPPKQWDVWRRFIYTSFKSSVVIGAFIQNNREWYSQELLTIADECKLLYN